MYLSLRIIGRDRCFCCTVNTDCSVLNIALQSFFVGEMGEERYLTRKEFDIEPRTMGLGKFKKIKGRRNKV